MGSMQQSSRQYQLAYIDALRDVELMFCVRLAHILLVALIEVLGQHNVSGNIIDTNDVCMQNRTRLQK
jgi:hypothetical protein